VLLALIPAAIAILLYAFMGLFLGAHIMLVAAAVAVSAGLQYPKG
jgi:hypothetical protein